MVDRRRIALATMALSALLSLPAAPVHAQVSQRVAIEAINTVAFGPGLPESGVAAGLGTGEVDLTNADNARVRARLQLRAALRGDSSIITVPRAEIRWRMSVGGVPSRLRAGRTRLSWGEGALYNAGDVINGAAPANVDLSARTLRDETLWLVSGYVPLGRFSFLEPVFVLPDLPVTEGETSSTSQAGWRSSAGLRVQQEILGVKTEWGYLYRGAEELHQPYVSVQGRLGLDVYGAGQWQIGQNGGAWVASGGVFGSWSGPRAGTASARLEVLWSEADGAFLMSPDVSWAPSQLLSFFARAQANTWDADGPVAGITTTGGLRWTPTTGLSLSGFVGWDRALETVSLGSGARYVF